jgi:hypothetical protein
MRIVETDNFGGDYPDESFLNVGVVSVDDAIAICAVLNERLSGTGEPRYWKIVEDDYKLQPGFEP